MLNRQQIIETICQHRSEIQRYGIKRLALFGSFSRNEEQVDSDLDFVVEFREKTFDAYMGLKEYLEGLFGRPVDLVLPDTIKPRLRSRIMGELIDAA